ncbi:hypothetical protein PPL_03270 [Heterostelium album PN500]|uniref:Uncharacterized protein n=1 Tax=Heterostelium pallidum (strain ATCC 26659 / Pp 5 / PN500) TaxID=670386 RepID=D3B4E6_HETP5|nr:hypothetical protein PPL_03270 [Heterostelium album PN500]
MRSSDSEYEETRCDYQCSKKQISDALL